MSEVRLIDANALERAITKRLRWGNLTAEEIAIREEIDAAPTIDAVEVVRCRDCRNMWTRVCEDGSSRLLCMRTGTPEGYGGSAVKADHFCSYGERKEAAHE